MADNNGVKGYQEPTSGNGEFNATHFLINSLIAKVNTTALVQVMAVSNNDELAPVGFVDMKLMVNPMAADGTPIVTNTIYHCCYFRLQGGANAIILDPKVGDIGIAVFASRDISAVQRTKKRSNPGSARTFDIADGIYLGGVLNGQPTQYVRFAATGIELISPTAVTINAPNININGAVHVTGSVQANGKTIDNTHTHNGVQTGGGNTGAVN